MKHSLSYRIGILLLILISLAFSQRYGESDDFSYALKLYNEGFYDIAAQQFNLFVNRYPNSERVPDARYYQGMSLFQLGEYENARVEFQSLAVEFPDHSRAPEAWLKVGECYLKLHKPEEAARAFETVKVLYPNNANAPEALYRAARIYLSLNKLDKAEIILQDFLDRYPDSAVFPAGRLLYAELLVRKGNFAQARKEYEKVLKSDAGAEVIARAHLGMARYYQELGLVEEAQKSYLAVIDQFAGTPALFPAVRELGELHIRQNHLKDALQLLNKYLNRFKSRNQQAHLKLLIATVYYLEGNYRGVHQLLDALAEKQQWDSLQVRANFYLGITSLAENRPENAAEYFDRIVGDSAIARQLPALALEARKQLGLIALRTGNFRKGSQLLEAYLRQSDDGQTIQQIYQELIQTALAGKFADEAENLYQQLLLRFPHSSRRDDILFLFGKYYYSRQEYQTALQKFQQLVRQYPCSARYDSAQVYMEIIRSFHIADQSLGVNQLAKLLGRFLAGEDEAHLKLELARIYLEQLKNMDETIELAENITRNESDSTVVGQAYVILGNAWYKKARLMEFRGKDAQLARQKSAEAFKMAMMYLPYLDRADSVTYCFLNTNLDKNVPVEKQIEYWQHFLRNYPTSALGFKARLKLADLFIQQGDSLQALSQLDSVIAGRNSYLKGIAAVRAAEFLMKQGSDSLAEGYLKSFLLDVQVHPLKSRAYKMLADLREAQGDYLSAAGFWKRIMEEFDYTDQAEEGKWNIPRIYLLAEKYQDAVHYLTRTFSAPEYPDIFLEKVEEKIQPIYYFYLGKAYYFTNKTVPARRNLLAYLVRSKNQQLREEALLYLGILAREEGNIGTAIIDFQQILTNPKSPFFVQASSKLADIYFEQKDFEKAKKLYAELSSRVTNPDEKMQFAAREIICFIQQGQLKSYQTKLKAFKTNYKKQPQLKNYLALFEFEIGKYYFQQKKYDPAIKRFKTVTKKYKNSDYADDARYYLGLTYTTMNRVEDAQKILTGFIEKNPESPLIANVYITLGSLYYRGEKPELAVEAFQKAVEKAQDRETRRVAMSNLIALYRELGLWDGLLTQARKYVEEYPDAPDVMDKKILIGTTLTRLNRFTEAIDYLRKLKYEATSEQEPEIQFYIGEAYFNAGQYENAIREFVKIPLLSKQTKLQWEASALYYSGQAYEKMGRINDAIRMYQEIVQRPGILPDLKREARKRINQLKKSN